MIAVIDYGVGNLFSLTSSLAYIGVDAVVTHDPEVIASCDKIILPGVGAFEDAAKKLHDSGMDVVIKKEAAEGKPILGICLGMQMLFEKSYEYGEHQGLGLIPGSVKPLNMIIPGGLKIPQMGWNKLDFTKNKEKSILYRYISEEEYVYFVHSYAAVGCDDYLSATTEYGTAVTASVEKRNVYGTQFHPETSGATGLKILKAFCE